jgi:hypothetical protein
MKEEEVIGEVTISSTNGTWGQDYHWRPAPGYTVRQLRGMKNDGLIKLVEKVPRNAYHTTIYDVVKV